MSGYRIKGLAPQENTGYRIKGLVSENPQYNTPQSFEEYIKQRFDQIENGPFSNAMKEVGTGIKEGAQSVYSGLTGNEFTPSPTPDTEGSTLGRMLGEMISKAPLPILGSVVGGAIGGLAGPFGIPVGSSIGGGLASAAITPGGAPERIEAGILGGLPLGVARMRAAPFTKGLAAAPLREAEKKVYQRGVKNFPIDQNILKEASNKLPNTDPVKKLIEDAAKGDYKALFTLQSDLKKQARDYRGTFSSGAERRASHEIDDLAEKVVKSLKDQLEKEGHGDLAKLLAKGKNNYRLYKKLDKTLYPVLKMLGTPIGAGAAAKFGWDNASKLWSD